MLKDVHHFSKPSQVNHQPAAACVKQNQLQSQNSAMSSWQLLILGSCLTPFCPQTLLTKPCAHPSKAGSIIACDDGCMHSQPCCKRSLLNLPVCTRRNWRSWQCCVGHFCVHFVYDCAWWRGTCTPAYCLRAAPATGERLPGGCCPEQGCRVLGSGAACLLLSHI